jgi:hypothetical protein
MKSPSSVIVSSHPVAAEWRDEAGAGLPPSPVRRGRPACLRPRDRELLALLGLCRYLTVPQVVALFAGGRTEKAITDRLRTLAGEARGKAWPFTPTLLRPLSYRAFDGQPKRLWGLTVAGCAVAAGELGRILKPPRPDVGALFAEHFVSLTQLFVRLAQPYLAAGGVPRTLPFRWCVSDEVELPWQDADEAGCDKARVIRPDAVLEVPSAQRRFFIECETGTHTLEPLGPDKPQATVRKLERYDAFVSGLADVPAGLSHYRRKYTDGWPCEVLFLVGSPGRQDSTQRALAACLERLAGTRLLARAVTLEEATTQLLSLLPRLGADAVRRDSGTGRLPGRASAFYDEPEHGAVKDFVLDMTAALAEANALLQGHGLTPVPGPASKSRMLDFLRKAQAEMQKRRTAVALRHA